MRDNIVVQYYWRNNKDKIFFRVRLEIFFIYAQN